MNAKIVESARKVLALPLERELSVSTGTFLNNDDVIKESYSCVCNIVDYRKTNKNKTRHTVETT